MVIFQCLIDHDTKLYYPVQTNIMTQERNPSSNPCDGPKYWHHHYWLAMGGLDHKGTCWTQVVV